MNDFMELVRNDWPTNAVVNLRNGSWLVCDPRGEVVREFTSHTTAQLFFEEWLRETMAE